MRKKITTFVGAGALFLASLLPTLSVAPASATYFPRPQVSTTFVMGAAGLFPADAATYYFGFQPGSNAQTATDGGWYMIAPFTGNASSAYGEWLVNGTLGSSGSITVTLRDVTANTTENITTSLSSTSVSNPFSNTAMTLAVTQGDVIMIKFTTPTWSTNPTTCYMWVTVNFR